MCRVLNARIVGKAPAPGRVYIGRPGKWGNPFVIGRDGSREEVIAKYRAWVSHHSPNCSMRSTNCVAVISSAGARRRRATATC